jgi:hypothetical protein
MAEPLKLPRAKFTNTQQRENLELATLAHQDTGGNQWYHHLNDRDMERLKEGQILDILIVVHGTI